MRIVPSLSRLRGTDADECTFGILASVVRSLRTAQAPPALARDPEFRDQWAMWAVQEGLHIARHRPADLADLTIS
ncbi:hypothetical protein JCM18916_1160 [Cutibacterium acnes JCM 18916]|nr:hypothetical protein JCM18916_1160 [Cutibacterium acnes JCM 18916]GAE77825.1 hypothetical protein JCM18918_3742 [Cutibacterium acnes JCM 18918]